MRKIKFNESVERTDILDPVIQSLCFCYYVKGEEIEEWGAKVCLFKHSL